MRIKGKIFGAVIAFLMAFSARSEAAVAEAALRNGLAEGDVKLVVGVSVTPHAGIMKVAGALLDQEGYTIELREYNDYTIPNIALADGSIDANFTIHIPHLIDDIAEMRYDLTWLAKVHVEPMALYSKSVRSLAALLYGATVVIPNNRSNRTRALRLLEGAGLIKVKDKPNLTLNDITENPKDLKIIAISPYLIPGALYGADAVVMNGNVAIQAGLDPMKGSIAIENENTAYANVLIVRIADMNKPVVRALAAALNSPEVRDYIEKNLTSLGIKAAF